MEIASNESDRPADDRKLIAVVHMDVVGYSRLIGLDDRGTVARLGELRRTVIDPAVHEHHGKVAQTAGDSLLIVFDSIEGAVRCAVRVQQQIPIYDGDSPPIRFRVGINIGDVIADHTDLHGEGVNVAVRLQSQCLPGSICVSRAVFDHAREQPGLTFEALGQLSLKNIARPVEAFLLRFGADGLGATSPSTHPARDPAGTTAPRLSFAVLPFDNLSGNPEEDYIAGSITEDLTTDLSRWPEATVVARNSAAACKARCQDVRQIGEELRVRYVIEGSVRRLGNLLRVNAQLISTETNAHLWAIRFDQDVTDLGAAQDQIVARLKAGLGIQLLETEIARGQRERPANPDVLDLLLRARSAYYLPYTAELSRQTADTLERALQLDATSTQAMCGIADSLLDRYGTLGSDRGNNDLVERADALVGAAVALEPGNGRVMFSQGYLLRTLGRRLDAIGIFERLIERFPNFHAAYRHLGFTKAAMGRPGEAIPLLQRSIRFDPLNSYNRAACASIAGALLMLGDAEAAIEWQQRALADGDTAAPVWRAQRYLLLASSHALLDRLEEARGALAEAHRLWPFATVRNLPPSGTPWGLPDPAFVAQMSVVRRGLRRCGLRDHADEGADFGIAPCGALQRELVGGTPVAVCGATTVVTKELVEFLGHGKAVMIDVALDSLGRSIPGSVGLQGSGHGDRFSENREARLRRKMLALTGNDLSVPIIAFCANSERFTGCNLALRLVALGHQQVYWYRGGFEAWQVNGLPESDLELQDW